jgi:peptidoglycan/LPS O-acetylase OafA/YrhL
MIPFLFIASRGSTLDKFLGYISYPFYVVHGLAAELAGGGVGHLQQNVVPELLLTIALSIALFYLVQRPIEGARDAIRKDKTRYSIPSTSRPSPATP